MPLSKDDRIAFSLYIVNADEQIRSMNNAKAALQGEIVRITKLDEGNKNLFDPVNVFVNGYQSEYGKLDGILRTTFVESNIQDSANRIIGNYFFPNNTATSVPSLAPTNIWTKVKPVAFTYSIGKNYGEAYGSTPLETTDINAILALITSTGGYTDLELTTGNILGGTCSNIIYTDQVTCEANAETWTPGYFPSSAIYSIKTNMVTAVNTLIAFLNAEVLTIVTTDTSSPNQTNNTAAVNNINNIILPALNLWLSYPDFEGTGSGPSKLHSTQMTALQTALTNRVSFIAIRVSQLSSVLGSITQNLSTGDITASSGLYGKRYGFLSLRLNMMGGSLSQLIGLNTSSNGQDSTITNITSTKNTYLSILPTSILKAPGNGTNSITLTDTSLFSSGDTVYIIAEGQEELQRAIKSVNGDTIILNDIVPAKYRPAEKARICKDIT